MAYANDDMTFCSNLQCELHSCSLNFKNVLHRDIPHSVADYDGTKYCKKVSADAEGKKGGGHDRRKGVL